MKQVSTRVGPFWIPDHEPDHVWIDWERGVADALLDLLPADRATSFVDVGANLGYFSRLAATERPACRVLALEPSPSCLPLLHRNLGEFVNARVLPFAASDRTAPIVFYWRDHAEGNGRAYDPSATDGNAWKRHETIAVALDDILDAPVDAVKMDIEGFEVEALRGATRVASAVVLEVHHDYIAERGLSVENFYAWLRECFEIHGDLPHPGNAHVVLRRRP